MELHRNVKPAAIICVLALACLATWLLPTTATAQETAAPAQAEVKATEPVANNTESTSQETSNCPAAADEKNCQEFCEQRPKARESDETITLRERPEREQPENCLLVADGDQTLSEEPEFDHDPLPVPPPPEPKIPHAPWIFLALVAILLAFMPASFYAAYQTFMNYLDCLRQPPVMGEDNKPCPKNCGYHGKWVWQFIIGLIVFAILIFLLLWFRVLDKPTRILDFAHACVALNICSVPCEEEIPPPPDRDPRSAHRVITLFDKEPDERVFRADIPTGKEIDLKDESSIRYSELLNIGDDHFLFLRDTKRYPLSTKYVHDLYHELKLGALKLQPSQYLGVVPYKDGKLLNGYTVPIQAPESEEGFTKPLPFDIESACVYEVGPARNLIHAIESGQNRVSYVANYYPRIMPLNLPSYYPDEAKWDYAVPDQIPAEVTRMLGSYPNGGLYNIEGHTCFTQGRLQLRIFAERGLHNAGQHTTPMSKIVIDGFDEGPVLRKIKNPQAIKPNCAPPIDIGGWHEVSALTTNEVKLAEEKADEALWGASSYASEGQVCSKIYTLNRDLVLTPESPNFKAKVRYVCDYNKIEGLAFTDDGNTLFVATDDAKEDGGIIARVDAICEEVK